MHHVTYIVAQLNLEELFGLRKQANPDDNGACARHSVPRTVLENRICCRIA